MTVIRRLIAIGLDAVTLALVVLWTTVLDTGGFTVRPFGIRFSSGSPGRVLIWIAIIVLVRRIAGSGVGPFGTAPERWRRLLISPGADPFLSPAPAGMWRRTAFASLGIALALAVLLHDQLWNLYSVPDLGDPLFSMWRIGWVLHQLVADPRHLFDGNIFYPEHLTLTLSDPIILPALMESPLLALGVHPVVGYNLLLASAFWMSGVATYLLVERLTGSPRAAFIAGLMYACYAYRFDHISHLELQMTQWMPLGLLALHLFVTTGRWPYAIALAFAGVAELYSSMYYAVFFFIYAAAIGVGLLVVYRPPLRRMVLPLLVAGALAGVMTVPIARAFIAAQPMKGERAVQEVDYYSAMPIDYLRAQQYSALWRHRLLPPAPERTLFPGLAPVALGAIGLAPPLGAIQLAYAAGLLVSFDGSLGLHGALYPSLYKWIAPVRGLRVPARFAAIVGLTLSILAGFGARRVLRWCRSRAWARVVFAALIAFVMIDAWPVLALQPVWKEPPSIYAAVKNVPGVVLADLPLPDHPDVNTVFMYFSLWHWLPMVNGYSGFIPQSYGAIRADISSFPKAEGIAAFRKHGVTHVTINCAVAYYGCKELQDQMARSPYLTLIAEQQWLGQPARLYELTGP